MTRGRTHNEAIAIARTSRAARAELGRAARNLGTPLASPLEAQRDWLSQAARTLLDIDQRKADAAATTHGRGLEDEASPDFDEAKERLLGRIKLVTHHYEESIRRAGDAAGRDRLERARPVHDTGAENRLSSGSGLGR